MRNELFVVRYVVVQYKTLEGVDGEPVVYNEYVGVLNGSDEWYLVPVKVRLSDLVGDVLVGDGCYVGENFFTREYLRRSVETPGDLARKEYPICATRDKARSWAITWAEYWRSVDMGF